MPRSALPDPPAYISNGEVCCGHCGSDQLDVQWQTWINNVKMVVDADGRIHVDYSTQEYTCEDSPDVLFCAECYGHSRYPEGVEVVKHG